MKRRTFVVSSAGLGTALLAGCTGGDSTDEPGTGDGSNVGTFRLLISDQPADISDFDSLEVTLSSARVFRGDVDLDEDDGTPTATPSGTASPAGTPTNATATPTGTPNGTATPTNGTATSTDTPSTNRMATPTGTPTPTATGSDAENGDDESRGFEEFDLGGETVELTRLVGDKALPVLETELESGTYSKIELYAADVQGVVDGESVPVKIPSEKLQIVKPFEVEAGGEVSFVFDINVVKKGNQGYNLLPVIAKSGVVGEDVEVEEVEDSEATETPEDEDGTPTGGDDATPTVGDDGSQSQGGQNQTDGNQTGQ